jgi:hypothetical protein
MSVVKLYWSPERGDNFTTATADGERDALAAGYQFIREEGYIFPTLLPISDRVDLGATASGVVPMTGSDGRLEGSGYLKNEPGNMLKYEV